MITNNKNTLSQVLIITNTQTQDGQTLQNWGLGREGTAYMEYHRTTLEEGGLTIGRKSHVCKEEMKKDPARVQEELEEEKRRLGRHHREEGDSWRLMASSHLTSCVCHAVRSVPSAFRNPVSTPSTIIRAQHRVHPVKRCTATQPNSLHSTHHRRSRNTQTGWWSNSKCSRRQPQMAS